MNIAQAIIYINPDARFICWENNYKKLNWDDAVHKGKKPTLAECETAWVEMMASGNYDENGYLIKKANPDPKLALEITKAEIKKTSGQDKQLITVSILAYIEDLEKRIAKLEK